MTIRSPAFNPLSTITMSRPKMPPVTTGCSSTTPSSAMRHTYVPPEAGAYIAVRGTPTTLAALSAVRIVTLHVMPGEIPTRSTSALAIFNDTGKPDASDEVLA